MTEVVINAKHGGFGLSPKASARYLELVGKNCYIYSLVRDGEFGVKTRYVKKPVDQVGDRGWYYIYTEDHGDELPDWSTMKHNTLWDDGDIDRTDPVLLRVVKELGKEADGRFSELKIVVVPDEVDWVIEEYDGWESVHEKHRVWG